MEILKLTLLEHSGQGENAAHRKVIDAFNKSEKDGRRYCEMRGWEVNIANGHLDVYSPLPFGFKMGALINQ